MDDGVSTITPLTYGLYKGCLQYEYRDPNPMSPEARNRSVKDLSQKLLTLELAKSRGLS